MFASQRERMPSMPTKVAEPVYGSDARTSLLRTVWRRATRGNDIVVKSGSYGGYLPDGIYGVDLRGGYALHEGVIGLNCRVSERQLRELREGYRVEFIRVGQFVRLETTSGSTIANLSIDGAGFAAEVAPIARSQLACLAAGCEVRRDQTALADYVEYRIRECTRVQNDGLYRLRVYIRYLAYLERTTIESLVVKAGIMPLEQIRSGMGTLSHAAETRIQPYKLSDAELKSAYSALRTLDLGTIGQMTAKQQEPKPRRSAEPLREEEYDLARSEEDKLIREFLAQWERERKDDWEQEEPQESSDQRRRERELLAQRQVELDTREAELDARKDNLDKEDERLTAEKAALEERARDLETEEERLCKMRDDADAERKRLDDLRLELEAREAELSARFEKLGGALKRIIGSFDELKDVAAEMGGPSGLEVDTVTPDKESHAAMGTGQYDGAELLAEESTGQDEVAVEPVKKKPHTPHEKRIASMEQAKRNKEELIRKQMEKRGERKKKR